MASFLGERIRTIRKEKGLKAKEVADAVGVSQASISFFETGAREPSLETLEKLAAFFKVTVGYFFGVSEDKEKLYKDILNVIRVPIYSGIRVTENNILGYQDMFADLISEKDKYSDYFGIRVDTKSMEPKITLGDVLILTLENNIQNDDVIAVLLNKTDSALYTYKETSEGIVLMPNNLTFAPRFFQSKEDMAQKGVRFIGKVLQQFRKY